MKATINQLINSYFYKNFKLLLLLLVVGCTSNIAEKNNNSSAKDSVETWLNQSKSRKLTLEERKKALEKAYDNVNSRLTDSIKLANYSQIAYQAEYLNNDSLFKKVNDEALSLAIKLKDTFKIGDAHWNYGVYYQEKEVIDSAYYHFHKAYENFKLVKHELYTANMLYNLGFIQGRIKDYTGSEISLFEAIEIYKKLNRYLNLYQCYNYLGLVYNNLEEYERAIFYNNKALEYLNKVENKGTYKEYSLSNLGLVYQKQQEYDKAIENFEAALNNSDLKRIDINFYARLVDNIAYTIFLKGDTTQVENRLNYALNIRDSLNNSSGIVMSKRHLSEFYAAKSDTFQAIKFAKDAFDLANEVENNNDKLETLLLLSKVDNKNSNIYLAEYVHLNDSLQIEDRKTRNKFTRIRFETDEYIEETEKLTHQRLLLLVGGIFTFLLITSIFIMRIQRARNKELMLEQEQQKANEEIFSLMLKQQSKLEEGRLRERHRISEDLHDGVLGKIFGTRLGLGFLNIKGDEETIEKHKNYIDELQNIEKEIRTISHELKNEILNSKEDFSKIIEELIEQKSKLGNFKYYFLCDNEIHWNELKDAIKINLYRIIQEALQNVIKYAEANFVNITIVLENKNINLVVEDNGKGFNVNDKRKGIGLKNMQSRASKLRGIFNITSSLNKGTKIAVSCPIEFNQHE